MRHTFIRHICCILLGSALGCNLVHASPAWTITPVVEYPNVVLVPETGSVLVKYTVTNQSNQPHTLVMKPINGVAQLTSGMGVCASPIVLSGKQACTLVLQITGSQVSNSLTYGPELCQKGGTFQCYTPASDAQLTIVRSSRAEIKLLASPSVITLQAGYSVAQTIRITNTSLLFTAQNIQATLPAGWDVTQNASACTLLAPGMSCDLQLTAGVSTYPATTFSIQGINTQATQVEGSVVSSGAATLSLSTSTLALSVDNPGLNAALSGTPRYITIQNTGSNLATTVTYTPSTNIYFSISPLSGQGCLSSISSGNSCTLTVTPSGATPTPNGAPVILSIAATNSESPVTSSVSLLTYGSIYQGGYVFAIDDNTPTNGSVGGKVVAQQDQSLGMIWSVLNGYNGVSIWGVDETSTAASPSPNSTTPAPNTAKQYAGQTSCGGATDGLCNTNNIVVYYTNVEPKSPTIYAAGVCSEFSSSGYIDWGLPAICEQGYQSEAGSDATFCGTQTTPKIQNIQSSLVDNGNIGQISGTYWSSTENAGYPIDYSWYNQFSSSGSIQNDQYKDESYKVRCIRALTL